MNKDTYTALAVLVERLDYVRDELKIMAYYSVDWANVMQAVEAAHKSLTPQQQVAA